MENKLTLEHLKKFKVGELKSEIMKFKKDINIRGMKRKDAEEFILLNKNSFKHMIKMKTSKLDKDVKAGKPSIKQFKKDNTKALKEIKKTRDKEGIPKVVESLISNAKKGKKGVLTDLQEKSLTDEQRKMLMKYKIQYRDINGELKDVNVKNKRKLPEIPAKKNDKDNMNKIVNKIIYDVRRGKKVVLSNLQEKKINRSQRLLLKKFDVKYKDYDGKLKDL